ncbi:MAG: HPr family phosphocarrier protein [Treponemataceae bacterium]
MVSKKVTIQNETGLHARPGNEFVTLAKTFKSEIELENNTGKKVKATSLMKIMTLGIKKGCELTIYADGEDEQEAVAKLEELIINLKD